MKGGDYDIDDNDNEKNNQKDEDIGCLDGSHGENELPFGS